MHLTSRWHLANIKQAYADGENIMSLLRDQSGLNEQDAILLSYDLQTGTYTDAIKNSPDRPLIIQFAHAAANVIALLQPTSLLDAGVGEATTFSHVLEALVPKSNLQFVTGFDISWSRILYAQKYVEEILGDTAPNTSFFVGELEAIALESSSVDVVFTTHAIEPNYGREHEILLELYRVAKRYLVLLEPAYEFADEAVRKRMEEHKFCRGLGDIAREMGWNIVEHRIFDVQTASYNLTGLLLIEKPTIPNNTSDHNLSIPSWTCPNCQTPLVLHNHHYFCSAEGLVYTVLNGIPCLVRSQSIVATKYMEG
jgi:Methyltransferase domain